MYIKILEIRCSFGAFYDEPRETNDRQEMLQATVPSFLYLIAKEKETWMQGLISGRQSAIIALLASLPGKLSL